MICRCLDFNIYTLLFNLTNYKKFESEERLHEKEGAD